MEKILDELKGAKSIGISGHIRPDGDCVGSCMAMYMYLKNALPKETEIDIILEPIPEDLKKIACTDMIRQYPRRKKYDVFIALDVNAERLGESAAAFKKAGKTINIDHHISNAGDGDVNYIFPEASSASELAYELMDKKYVDVEIAKSLYIGIIHDTGVMQYSNTHPSTLRVLAELLEYGFDFPKLIDETFYEKTYTQNQILGRALTESILFLDGKCIVAGIGNKTMKFYGIGAKDVDGIVNQLRITKGVEVAIFTYEYEASTWKVSLRSNGLVDVSKVCEFFGGGGHVRAAGAVLHGTYHDVINNLSERIALQLGMTQ